MADSGEPGGAGRRNLVPGRPPRPAPQGGAGHHCIDKRLTERRKGSVPLSPWWDVGWALERKCSHYTRADHLPAHNHSSLGRNSGGVLTLPVVVSFCGSESDDPESDDWESDGEAQCYCAQFCPGRSSPTHHTLPPETPTTKFTEELQSNTKKNDIYQTSNCSCPFTNFNGRIFSENYTKRLKRLNNVSGHQLGPKLSSGASTSEVWAGAVLLMVAMAVGSCGALPTHQPRPLSHAARTLPTHQPRPLSHAARTLPTHQPRPLSHAAHQPFKKDWRLCCGSGGAGGVRPANVTVLRTTPTSVLVTWTRPTVQPLKYEITYKPTNAKYRVVAEVVAPQRSVVLERLLPLTQYQVYVTTVVNSTMVWTSPVVTFHTATDDARHGNISGHLFSTPTVLGNVEVSVGTSVGSMGGADHKVGLVRVRAEEVGIVLLVLAVWMFAIALFFNRWGKIRMLEPYQEPYKEAPPQLLQHRPSCPMADPCALPINTHKAEHLGIRRPRQNSVFVGRTRSHSLEVHPPRRVKSALNLTTLVLQESEEEGAMATTLT